MNFLTNVLADNSIFNERQFWIVVSGEDGERGRENSEFGIRNSEEGRGMGNGE